METKNFENGTIGFVVKDIKELLAAKSLGFFLVNARGEGFDEDVTDQDEDGVDYEREPTEEEKTNQAIEELQDGCLVYAACWLPNYYELVKQTDTILQSDFFVGQEVYFMQDNKIQKAKVVTIQICRTSTGDSGSVSDSARYKVRYDKNSCSHPEVTLNDSEIFATKAEIIEHLTNNVLG